jgi:aspartate carbamoyltransferase catalytic subunit
VANAFSGSDILSMKQFSASDLELLFDTTDQLAQATRKQRSSVLPNHILLSAFFQSSTRTRLSHEAAMLRLGGSVLGFADPKTTRAGDYEQETLNDTAYMLNNYADVIVVRHPTTGAAREVADICDIPVINAGDGWGEHPTQVLADLYTMRQRHGRIDGLNVGLLGDFRVRCMHSMILGLSLFDCNVVAVSPPDRWFDNDYLAHFEKSGRTVGRASSVDEILPDIDVLYMGSAVQQPNFSVGHDAAIKKPATPNEYCVTIGKLRAMAKPNLIVLDALARGDELATDVDDTPFNGYWAEASNAVTVRMALLKLMLEE